MFGHDDAMTDLRANSNRRVADMEFDNAFAARRGWADVICDGRRPVDFLQNPLPDDLPAAGIATDAHTDSGVRTVPYSAPGTPDGHLTVSVHPLPGDWRAVVTRFVYPDGFVAACVTGNLGAMHGDSDSIWNAFRWTPTTGVNRAFWPTDDLWKVTDDNLTRGLQRAAQAFRSACWNPYDWYSPADVPGTEDGVTAAGQLITLTGLGFASWVDGNILLANGVVYDDVMAALDAGFNLDFDSRFDVSLEDDDFRWVTTAASGQWAYAHTDWWAGLKRLQKQGWTLLALKHLHPTDVVNRVSKTLNDGSRPASAYGMDLPWRTVSRADEWLTVTGSPRMASACIEAGLGLDETARMVAEGQTLNFGSLRMLAALRHPNEG